MLNAPIGTASLLPDVDFLHLLLADGRKSRQSPCWWSCSVAPRSEVWPSKADLSTSCVLAHRTSVAKASKFPSPGRSSKVNSGRYISSAETCHQPSKCRTVLHPTGASRRSKPHNLEPLLKKAAKGRRKDLKVKYVSSFRISGGLTHPRLDKIDKDMV